MHDVAVPEMHVRCADSSCDRAPVQFEEFFVAGLVPLFPTFALIAHYIVGTERAAVDLRATALLGLWSLIPYAIYLGFVYWLSVRFPLVMTLLLATAAWCVGAALLLFGWFKVYPGGA